MAILDLFIAASIPVLKLLIITALGAFLALDQIDILGADSRKYLNSVVFFVYNPSLLYSNLAKTITYESMVQLWFMPVNIFITFIIGSVLGWLLNLITRPPPHLRGLVLACCAGGNLGHLLLIIIPATCEESASPFGDRDVCRSYGMAYASLSMAVGAIFLWSYCFNILRIYANKSSKEVEINDCSVAKSTIESSVSPHESITKPLLHSGELDIAGSKDTSCDLTLPSSRFDRLAQGSPSGNIKHRVQVLVKKLNLKKLFAPSTLGAMAGFVVGLVPLFRRSIIGNTAPLRVIEETTLMLGNGAIPSLTLIMGGNLLKGLRASETPKSIISGIIVVRYILMPGIGIGIVRAALRLGLVNSNPLYEFVLLLQFSLPPAMNIVTMTQLFGVGESECSVIMLWSYAFASVALTVWSTFFMWLVG